MEDLGKNHTQVTQKSFRSVEEKQRSVLAVTHALTICVCFMYNMERKNNMQWKKTAAGTGYASVVII